MVSTLLIDGIVVCIVIVALFTIYTYKRNKYAKDAQTLLRAEIELPTGWTMCRFVDWDINTEEIDVDGKIYSLNPNKTRWSKYPLVPFLGLKSMQVPIRTEYWYEDNPNPKAAPSKDDIERLVDGSGNDAFFITGERFRAKLNNYQSAAASMDVQLEQERQDELTRAIGNQPNKAVVYISLITTIVLIGVVLLIVAQIGGLV